MVRIIFILIFTVFMFGCNSSDGGDDSLNPQEEVVVEDEAVEVHDEVLVEPQKFSGFDFTLQQGDFWQYQWDYSSSSYAMSDSSSGSASGEFRVVLGPTKVIDGYEMFSINVTGEGSLIPRWSYITLVDNKFLVSDDESSVKVLFNATTGEWPGSGFFDEFSSSKLLVATNGTLSNDFLTQDAIRVSYSTSKEQCEYFAGVGSICGDDSYNYTQEEYYAEGLGPIGYYYYSSYSDCGGGFCSGSTTIRHLGLVSSSLMDGVEPLETTSSVPANPTELKASLETNTTITLSWSDNSFLENSYIIEMKDVDSGEFVVLVTLPADTTEYVVEDLEQLTSYTFRVVTENEVGYSEYSPALTVKTAGPPEAPTNLDGNFYNMMVGSDYLQLTWNQVENELGYELEHYLYGWYKISGLEADLGADVRSISLVGVTRNTYHSFRIRAFNEYGYSEYSTDFTLYVD